MEPFPFIMEVAVRVSLWQRDLDAAQVDLATLREAGSHGPMHDGHDLVLGAGVPALERDRAEAVRLYREGRQAMRDYGLHFPLALGGIDMAVLLPGEQATDEAIEEAREIPTKLRAAPFLERLEAATTADKQRSPEPDGVRSQVRPG